jgi:hypothetical protein
MSILKDDLNWRLRNASRRDVMLAMGAASGAMMAGSAWAAPGLARPAAQAPVEALDDEPGLDSVDDNLPPDTTGPTFADLGAASPAIAAIIDDTAQRALYITVAVAAGHAGRRDGLAGAARSLSDGRTAERRERMRRKAIEVLNAPLNIRRPLFGRYMNLSPAEMVTLSDAELTAKMGPVAAVGSITGLTFSKLARLFGSLDDHSDPEAVPPSDPAADKKKADLAAGKLYTRMEVFIRRVECLDDTGDPGGHDEIALGGYLIGATGNTAHVANFDVGENFTPDGKTNDYNGDMRARDYGADNPCHFGWLNINQSKPWPHRYHIGMVMAELDWGGFGSFLSDLWDAVGGIVKAAIASAVSAAIPIPGLGTLIGWGIGKLIDFIIACLEDDIVGSIQQAMVLGNMTKSYYDTPLPSAGHPGLHGHFNGKEGAWHKRDFTTSGKYRVKLGWKVYTDAQADKRKAQIAAHPKTKLHA